MARKKDPVEEFTKWAMVAPIDEVNGSLRVIQSAIATRQGASTRPAPRQRATRVRPPQPAVSDDTN